MKNIIKTLWEQFKEKEEKSIREEYGLLDYTCDDYNNDKPEK